MTGIRTWFSVFGLAAAMLAAGVGAAAAQDGGATSDSADPAHVRCNAMTAIFDAFDMTPAAMRDYLREGGTLEELAAERGVDLQALEQQWRERLGDCVDRAREAGAITDERAAAIHDALDSGKLTPFPRGDGPNAPGPQGVFMPGGWGMQPAADVQAGQGPRPQAGRPDSAGQGQGNQANHPPREDIFMPGGWGWVDAPQWGDIRDDENADWIGHPYYQGVFHPGGWGCGENPTDAEGVFSPGGWGCAEPVPAGPAPAGLYDSPGDDTIRPDTAP